MSARAQDNSPISVFTVRETYVDVDIIMTFLCFNSFRKEKKWKMQMPIFAQKNVHGWQYFTSMVLEINCIDVCEGGFMMAYMDDVQW